MMMMMMMMTRNGGCAEVRLANGLEVVEEGVDVGVLFSLEISTFFFRSACMTILSSSPVFSPLFSIRSFWV